jgi:glycogen phosphorylase
VLKDVLSAIASGGFSPESPGRYVELIDGLLHRDRYFLLADFCDYLRAQAQVDALFAQPNAWAACCLKNIAGMGSFSVDRTVQEYRDRVWCPSSESSPPIQSQINMFDCAHDTAR